MPVDEEDFHLKIVEDLATHTQILKDILAQTTKTNGRVTRLEVTVSGHDSVLAVAADAKGRAAWWKDVLGKALIGMAVMGAGALIVIVLQKTEVLNISIVSNEEYQQLP